MKNLIVVILLFLCGCNRYHRSELKHEEGYVIEKQYFPDTRQTVTGTGFTSKGSIVITSHQIGENEKYMVIFKCHHGVVFSINRSDLYANLQKGDTVRIDYFEMLNTNNEIKDLDFITAYKPTL